MTTDRDVPYKQIRDYSYAINTPSLTLAGNEPVPDEIIRDLLSEEWIETENCPRPMLVVVDELDNLNANKKDIVGISVGNYREVPTGHRHEFVNLDVPLEIEIRTIVSRQRMWNIMAEIRRIIYKWMLALKPYQVLYFDGFSPVYFGPHYFAGILNIRLTSAAIPAITRVVVGEETPASNPEDFTPNEDIGY